MRLDMAPVPHCVGGQDSGRQTGVAALQCLDRAVLVLGSYAAGGEDDAEAFGYQSQDSSDDGVLVVDDSTRSGHLESGGSHDVVSHRDVGVLDVAPDYFRTSGYHGDARRHIRAEPLVDFGCP